MNKLTIPFDVRYFHYNVYTGRDHVDLVVKWDSEKFSHYILNDDGEIIEQTHQLVNNPLIKLEANDYWHDYVSLSTIQKVYVIVTKHNYEVIIKSLNYLAQYFKLEDTVSTDFSMDHANMITDAIDALKQLFIATEDPEIDNEHKKFDELCQKYFFDSIMSNYTPEWTEEDKNKIFQQFVNTAIFFQKYSNQ